MFLLSVLVVGLSWRFERHFVCGLGGLVGCLDCVFFGHVRRLSLVYLLGVVLEDQVGYLD